MPLPQWSMPLEFDPRRIGNVAAWWDFSDLAKVAIDGNGLIQSVSDKSGNARNLSQSTASNRPAVSTINGISCGDWGTSASLKTLTSSLSSAQCQEFAIVAVFDGGSTFADFCAIMGHSNGGIQGFPSGARTNWLTSSQGGIAVSISTNGGDSTDTRPAALPQLQSPSVVQAWTISTGSSFQVGLDRTFSGRNWRGRIGEVIGWSSVLTASQRLWVREGLRRKWSISQ